MIMSKLRISVKLLLLIITLGNFTIDTISLTSALLLCIKNPCRINKLTNTVREGCFIFFFIKLFAVLLERLLFVLWEITTQSNDKSYCLFFRCCLYMKIFFRHNLNLFLFALNKMPELFQNSTEESFPEHRSRRNFPVYS